MPAQNQRKANSGKPIREVRWRNQLKTWRLAAGMSVPEAATAFGVTEYVYMKWECGESEPPATPFLRIPEIFGVAEADARGTELVAVAVKPKE